MSVDAVVKALASLAQRSNIAHPGLAGHFANVIDIGGARIAIATDGVGTKHMLATKPEHFRSIGIDCAAMNVNDLICVGARPLALVDYLAIESADGMEPYAAAIADGFAQAESEGCGSIVGGEVAVLPGIIAPRDDDVPGLDLAATAIGVVEADLLDGSAVRAGDVVVGVASSGLHSNGFTTARRLVAESGAQLDAPPPWGGDTLREQLLTPTVLYPRLMDALTVSGVGGHVHAAANITGGGISNIARVLPTVGASIDAWPGLDPLFAWIADRLDPVEAFATFNMGVGFVLVVDPDHVEEVIRATPNTYSANTVGVATDTLPAGTVRLASFGIALEADRDGVWAG